MQPKNVFPLKSQFSIKGGDHNLSRFRRLRQSLQPNLPERRARKYMQRALQKAFFTTTRKHCELQICAHSCTALPSSARANKVAEAFGPTSPCHVNARGCHFWMSPPLIENCDFKGGPLSAQICTKKNGPHSQFVLNATSAI